MTARHDVEALLQPHLEKGLELWLEGEALRFKAPKELLNKELMGVLKANKENIILWLQSESEGPESGEPELVDEYPLAYTQGAIWMLYKFAPNSPAYNTTFACTLSQQVDENAVRQAFHALLIRHPVLRSTFTDTDTGPKQQVWSHLPMPLKLVDGSQWNEQELQRQLDQEADAPFDLQHEPCLRVKIFFNTIKGDILIATIQHVGADLWALLIVAQDIKSFYQKATLGDALSVDPVAALYKDHVRGQQGFMESPRGKKERRYWQQQLQSAPLEVSLPSDFPRPSVLQLKTDVVKQIVSTEAFNSVKAFCKNNSITPFVFVQAAFQLLIHQYTNADDFLVGTPTMGRSRKGMDQVVGDFANPVVLRAQIDSDTSLKILFSTVKKTLLSAMEHQECPFPVVVQDCNPPRDSSRTPLFQLMFVWHQGNADMIPKDGFIQDVLPMSGPRGAPYDVMLAVSDLGDHFELNWTYQTSMYRQETVERFGQVVQRYMDQFLQQSSESSVLEIIRIVSSGKEKETSINSQKESVDEKLEVIMQAIPELKSKDCAMVSEQDSLGDPIDCLYVESSYEQLAPYLESLRALCTDVVVLPYLPKIQSGKIDVKALKKIAVLDQSRLLQSVESVGLNHDDVVVLHKQAIQPTLHIDELDKKVVRTTASKIDVSALDFDSRPDAWMVGEQFEAQEGAPTHLFQGLQNSARRFPDRGFLFLDGKGGELLYRYQELVKDAYLVASSLKKVEVNSGDIMLLQMQFDKRFFAVWWGAILAGVRPLVVATPEQYIERNGVAQKLYNVAHNFDELVVAADADRVDQTQSWLGQSKRVINADQLLMGEQEEIEFGDLSSNSVAFLQLTSGSTGTPKAIQITHYGVLHHVASSAVFNDYRDDDVSLNWLPFDHVVPILTTHLKDIVLGVQQIQLPTSAVLADPFLWLQTMSDYNVSYSWAPNFAYQRVVDALKLADNSPQFDLSCVRILMNAGEQVLAPVVKAFSAALAPYGLSRDAVQPAFGMAEACTCMTYNNNSSETLSTHFRVTGDPSILDIVPEELATHGFVDLGEVVPGVEVRITDDRNQLVKEGVVGRMQIRGPVITPGYLNNADANAEAFVGDGWFNSGDLGFIWNQRLTLTGREKETIVVNGANYYCFDMESATATLAGIVPTFVAATGVSVGSGGNSDVLILFYVPEEDVSLTILERQIIACVSEAFGVVARYALPVEKDGFYKTTSGKIQRGQFKKLFESGFYDEQVKDFDLRHSEAESRVDTVYQYSWIVDNAAPVVEDGGVFELSNFDQNRSSHEQVSALADYVSSVSNPVIDMGCRNFTKDGKAEILYQVSSNLALLSPILTQHPVQPVLLWFQLESKLDLISIKPLIETLQQETGNTALRCVVTPSSSTQKPEWPKRAGITWQEEGVHSRLGLASVASNPIPNELIKRNGLYLITGGLGGLAEALCHYLIIEKKAKVILSGRNELHSNPKRQSQFNQLAAQFGASNLYYVCLPNWQSKTLESTLSQQLAQSGKEMLDGVFHLAGSMEMLPLTEVNSEHWHGVLDAKVNGSFALANYLQKCNPSSFLIQYGSLNSYFGGQAAAAYSVANAVQSQLTENLNVETSLRSWCLNWSVWQGAGMALRFSNAEIQMAKNKGFVPLQVSRDLPLLDAVLQLPPANYFVGLDATNDALEPHMNWFSRSRHQIQVYVDGSKGELEALKLQPQALIRSIMPLVHDPDWHVHISSDAFQRNQDGQVVIELLKAQGKQQNESVVKPETELEVKIAEIWGDVLGRDVNDVSRSFFEYGGHSINATQVVAALNNKLGLPVAVAQLFQYPTIRELAENAGQQQSHHRLSLTLKDCIQRADNYRVDVVNPEIESDTRLVFLPTALGLPNVYGQMVSALDQYSSYVVSMPATRDDAGCHGQALQQAAVEIAQLLKQNQLVGDSIALIGWSMAGVLGYEILQQLQQDSVALPRLIMLDSGFADGLHEITFDDQFQRLMFAVELGLSMDKYADFNQQHEHNKKLQWLQQYLETIGIEVTVELLVEWWKAYDKRLKSLLSYQILSDLRAADITLLKADHHSHGRDDLGWKDIENPIKWISIQADHQGIVKSPHAIDCIREQLL